MKVDLHIHSYFSDGTQSPEQVVKEAYDKGIGMIAVCDHNTVDGLERVRLSCQKYDIVFIKGVEIDCTYKDKNVHVLAYEFDEKNKELLELLNENVDLYEDFSIQLIKNMSKDYPGISLAEYETFNRTLENGGWKGIDYLRSKGFEADYPDCMQYYKQYNCKFKKPFMHIADVCGIVKKAGGYTVLAHPGDRLDKEGFSEDLLQLREYGVDGIECYYPSHSEEITNTCVEFCNVNHMLITSGGDGHGEFAKIVDGVLYEIGVMDIDADLLNLKGCKGW